MEGFKKFFELVHFFWVKVEPTLGVMDSYVVIDDERKENEAIEEHKASV